MTIFGEGFNFAATHVRMLQLRYDPFMTRRTLCALPRLSPGLKAADWPNWRGPSFDGVSPEKTLPQKWSRTD